MEKVQRYEQNEKLVYFVLNNFFPTVEKTEDLIQEGRLGLWKACVAYKEEAKTAFSTYACVVIYHHIAGILTKSNRLFENKKDVIFLSLQQPYGDEDSDLTVEECLCGEEEPGYSLAECLTALKQTLSPEERAICCKTVLGFNQREIARENGVTPQCISQKMRTVRGKLRKSKVMIPANHRAV